MALFRRVKPPFGFKTLVKDSNCACIQSYDIWGGADHLPRRNLLLATDTLATQNATVTAESHTLYIQGTGSVTLSGTGSGTLSGTGANDRVSLVFTPTAGTLTLTVSGTVTVGMLCKSSVTDRSYQKITDWTTDQYAHAAVKNVPWLRRNMLSNSTFANSGGTAPTGYSAVFGTGTSAPDGTAANGDVIYSQSATAQRPLFQSGSFSWQSGLTYTLSLTVHAASGLVAGDIARFASLPSGATITFPVCSANPSGGVSGALTAGQFVYKMTVGATAGASTVYLGIGCNGAATGTLRFSSPQLEIASGATTHQKVDSLWSTTYTTLALAAGYPISLYSDRAGTVATYGPDDPVGKLLDLSGENNHATAPSDAARPNLRLDGNGRFYLERDPTDDALAITWPANFTTTAAQYVADQTTTTETTGITLNGATSYTTPQRPTGDYGRIIFKAPTPNAAKVVKYLDKKAGR